MSKKIVLTSIAFAFLGLMSCKKNYTCECTSSGGTSSVTFKETKKKAEDACKSLNSSAQASGGSCSLK